MLDLLPTKLHAKADLARAARARLIQYLRELRLQIISMNIRIFICFIVVLIAIVNCIELGR